jgi:hypothetical protein
MKKIKKRSFRPTPALVVAFVALFAAMGGVGYSAVKLTPNSVKTKNLKPAAVTTNKIADGAVTTPKLAADAVAPNAVNAMNAANAANAAKLGGAAPGECQTGWLSASLTVNTANIVQDIGTENTVPGFNCASKAGDAVTITREAVGQYTVTFADNDAGIAISSSAGANAVTAATELEPGSFLVKTWKNSDATFTDGITFSLIAY